MSDFCNYSAGFMIDKNIQTGFNFDNSYINLPKEFYSHVNLKPVKSPKLVILNNNLASSLGLSLEFLKSPKGISILSGNTKADDGAYISQAYAGHQFGHFTMLGDGSALLIGEHLLIKDLIYSLKVLVELLFLEVAMVVLFSAQC